MIDVDEFDGDAIVALRSVMPELATCAYVLRASTSAGIYNEDTLERRSRRRTNGI